MYVRVWARREEGYEQDLFRTHYIFSVRDVF